MLETPIREINEEKDKIQCLIVLMSKLNFGLDYLNTKVDGYCCMPIDCLNIMSFYDSKIII